MPAREMSPCPGFTPNTPERAAERGGMVILQVEDGAAVTRELLRRDVIVDHRPGAGIRFSPHFYTTDEEIDQAFDVVDDILRTCRWQRQQTRKTIVT